MKPNLKKEESISERLFSSEVKIELLVLFRGNPGITDTIEGVARRVGRTSREIESAVDDLVDLGVLKKRTLGSGTRLFSLDRAGDKKALNSLAEYIKAHPSTPQRM
jgi:hypothetical protein